MTDEFDVRVDPSPRVAGSSLGPCHFVLVTRRSDGVAARTFVTDEPAATFDARVAIEARGAIGILESVTLESA